MDRGGDNKVMKAYVFSIGERTTDLCCELMRKYGFEVVLYKDKSSLWDKMKRFYQEALDSGDDYFLRVDADIIPNRNVQEIPKDHIGYPMWVCSVGYNWYMQDRGPISIHYMNRLAIEQCFKHIEEAKDKNRPESHLWRIPDINPYTRNEWTINRGLHGYGQQDQRDRVKALKQSRDQQYDWDLIDRIESL